MVAIRKSHSWEPMNVALFGKRVFAVLLTEMKSSWMRMGPKTSDKCLRREVKGRDTSKVKSTRRQRQKSQSVPAGQGVSKLAGGSQK